MTPVYFEAQQVGRDYRGLVINAKTHATHAITAHLYSDRTTAMEAARRMHMESVPEAIQPFMPPMAMLEKMA